MIVKLKTVVIDDEKIAREGIQKYVEKIPFLELSGSYANPLEMLEKHPLADIDLLLLDIEMPGINGNEFLKSFPNAPLTIFITAYPQYAIEGYELDIIDYLLKPVKYERFYKAVNKALEYHSQASTGHKNDLWIKVDGALHKLNLANIIQVTSLQNYVQIHTTDKTFTVLTTLKEFRKKLSVDFIQCHKSYVVHKYHIQRIEGNTVYLTKGEAVISRNYRSEFLRVVTGG